MKALIIALLLAVSSFAIAQEKTIEIPLTAKKETLLDFIHIPGKGFVLKTGALKAGTKNVNWKLHFYDESLTHIWTIPIERGQVERGFLSHLIASSNADYVYHLEEMGYLGPTKWRITQVHDNNDKVIKAFDIPKGDVDALFVTSQGLKVFVSDLRKDGKKEQYGIHDFTHNTLKQTTVVLDLPKEWFKKDGEKLKETTQWYPIHHNDEFVYLTRKAYIRGSSKVEKPYEYYVQVAKCNYKGEVLFIHNLDASLDNWNYIPLNFLFDTSEELANLLLPTSTTIELNETIRTEYTYGSYTVRPTIYNQLMRGKVDYNSLSNQFVILSIYNEDIKEGGKETRGFSIITFDETGKKISERLIPLNHLVNNDDTFQVKYGGSSMPCLNYSFLTEYGYLLQMATKSFWYTAKLNHQLELLSLDHGKKENLTETERKSFYTSIKNQGPFEMRHYDDVRFNTSQGTYFLDVDLDNKMLQIKKVSE
ncbi:MAG: hypothetical protein MI974_07200 [Chitinophagales bacterium]|nr:hypothetical protein [Chitinophagales bacterium]